MDWHEKFGFLLRCTFLRSLAGDVMGTQSDDKACPADSIYRLISRDPKKVYECFDICRVLKFVYSNYNHLSNTSSSTNLGSRIDNDEYGGVHGHPARLTGVVGECEGCPIESGALYLTCQLEHVPARKRGTVGPRCR